MGALGKYVAGSGFEEIILEAGVCANGSLQQLIWETLQPFTQDPFEYG